MSMQQMLLAGRSLWVPQDLGASLFTHWGYLGISNVSGASDGWGEMYHMGNVDYLLTQGTVGARPTINTAALNGKNTLTFDGTADYMQNTTANLKGFSQNVSALWSFVIFKKTLVDTVGSADKRLIHSASGTSVVTRYAMSMGNGANYNRLTLLVRRQAADSAAFLTGATALGTGWRLGMVQINYATREGIMYLDAVQDASNATLTAATGSTENTASIENFSICAGMGASNVASSFADAEIAAIVTGRVILTTDQREKLEGWAAHFYGLTANLPALHPYKTVPPMA